MSAERLAQLRAKQAASGGGNRARLEALRAKKAGAPVSATQASGQAVAEVETPEEPGFMDAIGELFTGSERSAALPEEIRNLPEIQSITTPVSTGALGSDLKIAAGLLSTFDPEAQKDIILENVPGATFEEVNDTTAVNLPNGQRAVLNAPGFSTADAMTGVAQALAFVPAARLANLGRNVAAKIGLGGVGSGATETGLQGLSKLLGSEQEIDEGDIALATVLGAGSEVIAPAAKAAEPIVKEGFERVTDAAGNLIDQGKEAVKRATGFIELSPEAENLVKNLGISREEAADLSLVQIQRLTEEVGKKPIVEGIEQAFGGFRAGDGVEQLADTVQVDPKVLEAVQRLGVDISEIPENVLSTNKNFRAIFGAVQSIPGSPLASDKRKLLETLAGKAEDLVNEAGAEIKNAAAGIKLRNRMTELEKALVKAEEEIYQKNLTNVIGSSTEVNPDITGKALRNRVAATGLEGLKPIERKIYQRLNLGKESRPTWTRLDDLRKELNASRKNKGAFKDEDGGDIELYAGLIRADQKAAAEARGLGNVFEEAMATTTVKKGLQEEITNLFGKNLDRSLRKTLSPALVNLSKGDLAEFGKVVNSIPESERAKILTGAIGDIMVNSRGENALLDAAKFSNWFNDLNSNKAARTVLFKNLDPVARKKIKAMGKLASRIKLAGEDAIATGRLNTIGEAFKVSNEVTEALLSGGRAAATVGALKTGGVGFGSLVGNLLKGGKQDFSLKAAAVFNSPRFQNLVAQKAGNAGQETIEKLDKAVRSSPEWKAYVKSLNIPNKEKKAILQGGVLSFLLGTTQE